MVQQEIKKYKRIEELTYELMELYYKNKWKIKYRDQKIYFNDHVYNLNNPLITAEASKSEEATTIHSFIALLVIWYRGETPIPELDAKERILKPLVKELVSLVQN